MITMQAGTRLLLGMGFAVTAATSLAQYPGGGTPRGGLLGRPASQADQGPHPQENTVDQLEFRMYQLHADLRLRPAQEVAWGAFVDKVKSMVADIGREHSRAFATSTLNSMKQIDQTTDGMRNRLTALEDITVVARLLYEGLSPEQRALADPKLATIVQTALRIEAAPGDNIAADPGLDTDKPPPPKPGKVRFGPPPVPDPSRRDEVGR